MTAPNILYTTGYLNRHIVAAKSKLTTLKRLVEAMDAILIDIRFSPNSIAACWRKPALQNLLGDRYLWLKELGNRNYKNGGEFDIVDLCGGLETVQMQAKTPILMCGCEEAEFCHRKYVACHATGYYDDVIEILNWELMLKEVEE